MSKKYILLTSFIYTVGGGQIYCKNKSEYCKSQGFDTYVFSTKHGKIEIEPLKKYADLILEELSLNPYCFSLKRVDNILNWICEEIDYNKNDEIIIESHTPYLAIWGELLAKRIGAKHIVYLLGENFDGLSKSVFDCLKFKYNRKEVACISKKGMQKLFDENKECYHLKPALGNPVEDVEIPEEYIEKCNGKKVIGLIGRGYKSYVFESVKKLCDFAQTHKTEQFILFCIGGIRKKPKKAIKNYVKNHSNIEIIIVGERFPIPRKMLQLMNVCIAGAGCVKPPYLEGVPTISVDVYDNEAIGVYGYDTLVKLERVESLNITINEYLESILYGDFLSEKERIDEGSTDYLQEYKHHFEFIENSSKSDEFYEFDNFTLSKKEKLSASVYKLGGMKLVKFIKQAKLKIK